MKITVFLFIAILVFPAFANPQKSGYIGYKHKGVLYGEKLPNGVKNLGGGLLTNESYGISRYSKNGKTMLWLEKIAGRYDDGVPNWIVKDVLNLGKLKKNEELLFSYSSTCKQNDKEFLELIVKVQFLPKTKEYKVLQAWKANVKKERFEKARIKGVKCEFDEP